MDTEKRLWWFVLGLKKTLVYGSIVDGSGEDLLKICNLNFEWKLEER